MQTIRPLRSFTRSDFDSETFCVASVYVPVPIPMVVLDDQARIEQDWAQMAARGSPIVSQWSDVTFPSFTHGLNLASSEGFSVTMAHSSGLFVVVCHHGFENNEIIPYHVDKI